MPKKEKVTTTSKKPFEVVVGVDYMKAENVPTYYVNNARIGSSVWDMRIEMGQIKEADAKTMHVLVNPNVTIFMAWPLAKQLLRIMDRMIKQYESAFGEIHYVVEEGKVKSPETAEHVPEH